MHLEYVVVFVIYFAAMLAIGFYFWNKNRNMEEYVLGGRSLNPYVAALSAQASDMSGWMFLGLPGAIFLCGMGKVWIGIGLGIGSYLAWLLISKRLRLYSHQANDSLTLPEFLSNRFHDHSGTIRLFCSIVVIVFFTFYVTSGFVSGATVLSSVFNGYVSYEWAVVITAGVVMLYTFMGGFKAVCWTDFFQAILMLIAIVIVPMAALGALNFDFSSIGQVLEKDMSHFSDIFWMNGAPITAVALISGLAWGLGYFGMPHVISRYMALKDPNDARLARRVSVVWIIIALSFSVLVGYLGHAWYTSQPGGIPPGFNPETIFTVLSSNLLSPLIAGVVFAALMAAIMSTADSQLLVASSTVTNDFVKGRNVKLSEKEMMYVSRGAVLLVALLGMVLALDRNSSIMQLVAFAWSGLGAAFGPVVLCALFWRRSNRYGACAAMIVGFVTVILWNTFLVSNGVIPHLFGIDTCIFDTGLYELLPGFVFALIAMIVVSRYTEEPSKEMLEEFDRVASEKFY